MKNTVTKLINEAKLAFKLAKCLFKIFKLTCFEFSFTYELIIDHLKVLVDFDIESGDLDLQGQICHESSNVCVNDSL